MLKAPGQKNGKIFLVDSKVACKFQMKQTGGAGIEQVIQEIEGERQIPVCPSCYDPSFWNRFH
jgi:hypothetical protein